MMESNYREPRLTNLSHGFAGVLCFKNDTPLLERPSESGWMAARVFLYIPLFILSRSGLFSKSLPA